MGKVDKKASKKELRKQVYEKLASALAEYKPNLKEKRFASNLKKASKLFATDIAKSIDKKKSKIDQPAKKKALKPVQPEQKEKLVQG